MMLTKMRNEKEKVHCQNVIQFRPKKKKKFAELFNIQVERISENVKRIVLMDAAFKMKRHAQSALTRIRNPLIRQLKSLNYLNNSEH